MSSVVTFWYDVYSKTHHLDEVTIGIKKDYTPHYLYLLLYVFFNCIQRMVIWLDFNGLKTENEKQRNSK